MKPTTLSKSRFKLALECPRKLVYTTDPRYANTNENNDWLMSLADEGHKVGALAKLMYPGGIEIKAKSIEEQVTETQRLLEQENIILFEPTFLYENLLVRVDVLVKDGMDIKLIEVKSKGFNSENDSFRSKGNHTKINGEWHPYLYDVAFQSFVLERCHPEWNVTPYLMLLDSSVAASESGVGVQFEVKHIGRGVEVTVRPGFDPDNLVPPLLKVHDVAEEVNILRSGLVDTPAGQYGFGQLIEWLGAELKAGNDLEPSPGSQCKKCEFYCGPDEMTAENRSGWAECFETAYLRRIDFPRAETVLGLYGHKTAGSLLRPDRIKLTELDISDLNVRKVPGTISATERYVLQIEESKGQGQPVFLEKDSLREAIEQWQFPLHFIDFETSRPALPFHKGRRPNEQILFQFSHHILSEDGQLRHAGECLIADPGEDPSIDVVRALREALSGDTGTVVHWWNHESDVLKDIRQRILSSGETDRDDLAAFIDTLVGNSVHAGRLEDLGKLVAKTAYFQGTNGQSTLKKVLPAVLAHSDWLKERYSQQIYGTPQMPSLNFPAGWVWLKEANGQWLNPYQLLGSASKLSDGNGVVAEGSGALLAYATLQKPDLSPTNRQQITEQLKRYCELDTLAMAMVYEAIRQWII